MHAFANSTKRFLVAVALALTIGANVKFNQQ